MKNLLAFDTSGPVLSVALQTAGQTPRERKIEGFLKHAENLLPVIDGLLEESRLRAGEIDAFLIGRGPGSFTGLRIGFATLKGLNITAKKPCYGAVSLDMIAHNAVLNDGANLAVCLDARRDKIYARFYRRQAGRWKAKGRLRLLSPGQLRKALPAKTFIAGDAITRYGDSLKPSGKGRRVEFLPEKDWQPKATALIDFAQHEPGNLQALKSARDLTPYYFRLSDPEEKRKKRGRRR